MRNIKSGLKDFKIKLCDKIFFKWKKNSSDEVLQSEVSFCETAVAEYVQNAKKFTGLYEPLFMLSSGSLKRKTGLLNDWDVRISNLDNIDNLKKIWDKIFLDFDSCEIEELRKKAENFIKFLFYCGVKRENIEDIIIDSKTYTKYSLLDDDIAEIGNKVTIKTPCWILNDDVIEKGIITKI